MATKKIGEIAMIEELIDLAALGKKVDLKAKPCRDVIKLGQEGETIENVILSMEYSGTVDGEPFSFKKEYSHAYDESEYALDCLLIANNRLQVDYDRLKNGGIDVKHEFFTFQNTFLALSGVASAKRPALRLQNFIHLAHAGIPVSVNVNPKRLDIVTKEKDGEKKGFVYMATFVFTTEEGKTSIEKLYDQGLFDDTEERKARIREIATKRLERDCERLRSAGIKNVEALTF
jgi:hypothetical protein